MTPDDLRPGDSPNATGEEGGVMGLLEHYDELRSRSIKACIAIGAGMVAGFVLAAPVVAYLIRRFIAPGLYSAEKRLVLPFISVATVGTSAALAFVR